MPKGFVRERSHKTEYIHSTPLATIILPTNDFICSCGRTGTNTEPCVRPVGKDLYERAGQPSVVAVWKHQCGAIRVVNWEQRGVLFRGDATFRFLTVVVCTQVLSVRVSFLSWLIQAAIFETEVRGFCPFVREKQRNDRIQLCQRG